MRLGWVDDVKGLAEEKVRTLGRKRERERESQIR